MSLFLKSSRKTQWFQHLYRKQFKCFEIEVEIPAKQNISRIPKLRLRPSEAKYFENFQVEVETQRSQIFREILSVGWGPPEAEIYSRVWGWSSVPETYRRFFWRIKVEVVSQGQIFLEERPVIPGNSIWTQLFCSISWFECCIKTRLANYSSHVCKFESSQREGQSFDLFRVYHILFYRQLPLLCDSRFDLIRQYECGLAVWFQKSTHRAKILSHVLVHSTWREEQDVLEFAAFVSSYSKSLHFRNLQIFPALLIFNVRL